jgi:hypothetical protein
LLEGENDMLKDRYVLARVNLVKAGCPSEIADSVPNVAINAPIVIRRNTRKLGFVEATAYCPSAIVTSGAERRRRLLANGLVRSWALIERGALHINAYDAMSSDELWNVISQRLNERYKIHPAPVNVPMTSYSPYVVRIYPFENYFIYQHKGENFKQTYTMDPNERMVHLTGPPAKVVQKWIEASAGAKVVMIPSQGY